jgi:uncharacterized protein (DUF58 family)
MLRTPNQSRPKVLDDLLNAQLISRLDPLDLTSKRVFFGKLKGERRSKRRGQSVEFADHRPYTVGDDTRHIDWNIYARMESLVLKLFLEEEDLSLHLVLDCSASSDCGDPSKFLFMQKAVAALGYVGLVNLNRVTVTAMGDKEGGVVGTVRDLRGKRRLHDLANFLIGLEPKGGFSFRQAAERIALTRRGKGVMLVFSDFFFKDGFEEGLRRLVGHGYDVLCVQVLSPQELEPPLTGDLRLKDVEDGDMAEVTIASPLLKRYKANLAAYCKELEKFCLQRDMQCVTVRSDTPIDTLVVDYLRRKGVVK